MNIAIVLVHNKTPKKNEEQIDTLLSHLSEVRLPLFEEDKPVLDDEGNQKTYFSHYILNNLDIDHVVNVYQIVPFQPENKSEPYEAERPSNFNKLYSHNVLYGRGDEDKVGDHPRFFNWGLKRATDFGADIVISIDDISKFVPERIKTVSKDYVEDTGVKFATSRLLEEKGQIDEAKPIAQAFEDYKEVKNG